MQSKITLAAKHLLIILMIILLRPFISFATTSNQDFHRIKGGAKLHNARFSSLKVHGNLKFQNLFIEDLLKAHGSINGINLKCNNLQTHGCKP